MTVMLFERVLTWASRSVYPIGSRGHLKISPIGSGSDMAAQWALLRLTVEECPLPNSFSAALKPFASFSAGPVPQ